MPIALLLLGKLALHPIQSCRQIYLTRPTLSVWSIFLCSLLIAGLLFAALQWLFENNRDLGSNVVIMSLPVLALMLIVVSFEAFIIDAAGQVHTIHLLFEGLWLTLLFASIPWILLLPFFFTFPRYAWPLWFFIPTTTTFVIFATTNLSWQRQFRLALFVNTVILAALLYVAHRSHH